MRRFASLLALALLAGSAPVLAKERTESIRFTYLSAAVAEESLLGFLTASGKRPVLPAGIKVWVVDEPSNSVVLTGDAAAIEDVKKLARILDVPQTRVRLTLRSAQLSEEALGRLKRGGAVEHEGLTIIPVEGEEARRVVDAAPAGFSRAVRATNNRPVHLRLEGPPGTRAVTFSLIPRVNGDRTITLAIPNWDELKGGQAPGAAGSSLFALRRVASGQSVLVAGAPFPHPLVIGVELVPPAPAPPPPAR